MSRPSPRRPASSRGATPRPRKIAGRSVTTRFGDAESAPEVEEVAQRSDGGRGGRPGDRHETQSRDRTDSGHHVPGLLGSEKTTKVLIGVLAALALVLAGLTAWLVLDDEPTRTVAHDNATDSTGIDVPQGRPVIANTLAVQDGVEAAAKAAQQLVAVDHKKYDEEVDAAAELMTTRFEKQFRTTKADIKEEVVAQQTVVKATVVAQGVVRANRTELEALVFLNQVVNRVRDGKPETVATPYKLLVKMVHTDQGWLVDGLQTDDPTEGEPDGPAEDKSN
jgi:Mce-associated membrane protein